jgi:hypothetical protein
MTAMFRSQVWKNKKRSGFAVCNSRISKIPYRKKESMLTRVAPGLAWILNFNRKQFLPTIKTFTRRL